MPLFKLLTTDGFAERLEALEARLEMGAEALDTLKSLTGDPEALEATDLDASDAFDVSASEDGTVVVSGPNRERETRIPFAEGETDSFDGLAEAARDAAEAQREALEALMALTGDRDALEPTDLDASENFFVSESETGTAVLNGPRKSVTTQILFGEDTDSFAEIAALPRPIGPPEEEPPASTDDALL